MFPVINGQVFSEFGCHVHISYYEMILICFEQSAEDYNRDTCDSKFAEDLADRHILTEEVNRDFIADER